MQISGAFFYTIVSVLIVSLVSLVGVIGLSVKHEKLSKVLIYLISFSAGALLGDAFIHLLPEVVEKNGLTLSISFSILGGILIFFVLEKLIHWNHCHTEIISDKKHVHPFTYTNLVGDGLHNFIDGTIIAASYLISFEAGLATTIAVVLHEIPQEIGDFAVLLHGGFSKRKALFANFLSALLAFAGALLVFFVQGFMESIEFILVPIAAGGFIYIASSDLIPELHKHSHKFSRNILQLIAFVAGIAVMCLLLLLE